MAIAVGRRIHPQPEKLVLPVLGHDARIANAKKRHLAPGLVGLHQGHHRTLHGDGTRFIAVFQKGSHRVVDDFDHHVANLVVLVHAAVDKGHALVDGAGQFELEVREAVIAHAAAKTHHGGLADVRAVGQFGHRQLGKSARIAQAQLAHALFSRGKGRQRGFDSVQHQRYPFL